MSFPRAKVHRFNDIKPITPSPATYNTNVIRKPKGAVIPQSSRFVEKSPAPSENGSTKSSPCFRTPTLPKKKLPTNSSKIKLFSTLQPKPIANNESEQLKEKIVECENKDHYIRDLTEQLEEIKDKLLKLQTHKELLDQEKHSYEEMSNLMQEELESKQNALIEKHKYDLELINNESEKVKTELLDIKDQYKLLKEEQKQDLLKLRNDTDQLKNAFKESTDFYEIEIKQKQIQLSLLEQEIVNIKETHICEINTLRKNHNAEIQDMEFEMLKMISQVQKEKDCLENKMKDMEQNVDNQIENLKQQFEQEKENILIDSQKRLLQIEENYQDVNKLVEIQMNTKVEELESSWKAKLDAQQRESEAILKECQDISEYSIIQCELEKNEIKLNLTEQIKQNEIIHKKYNELHSSYEKLQDKYNEFNDTLNNKIHLLTDSNETLLKQVNEQNEDIQKMIADKRAYHITMNTYQETIEVLKKRLIHSDRDVEQLKQEISECEEKILELENNCQRLKCELKQHQEYNEELELQYESTLKINETEINNLKQNLIEKVQTYKTEADKFSRQSIDDKKLLRQVLDDLKIQQTLTMNTNQQIEAIKDEIDKVYEENEKFYKKERLYKKEVQDLLSNLDLKENAIEELQEKCDIYSEKITIYESKVKELEDEIKETCGIHKKYIEVSGKYDDILSKHEALQQENKQKLDKNKEQYENLLHKFMALELENKMNKKAIEEQRKLMEPFKEELERFEIENNALLGICQHMDEESQNLKSKYVEILGHQNYKQKIKHLITLKDKNSQLTKEKYELEKELRRESKITDKLKKENGELKKCLKKFKIPSENKENFGSPNKPLNTSRIESPGPLKEKN